MDCETFTTRLDDYLDGALDAESLESACGHLGGCAACAERVERARRLVSALAACPVEGPGEGFADRALRRAIDSGSARRPPRLIAAGFLGAFAASVFTVIYTGLLVEAPRTEIAAGLPMVSMTLDAPRTVNLVFASALALDDVTLLVDLPEGVELAGYEGRRQVSWRTMLESGRNVLPLELIARVPVRGELIAQIEHGDNRKVFRVFVSVIPG